VIDDDHVAIVFAILDLDDLPTRRLLSAGTPMLA